MYCRDCARWDSENRRCKDGKVNPHSWEETVNVANVLGVRAICIFNDHRERLVGSRLSRPLVVTAREASSEKNVDSLEVPTPTEEQTVS